MTRDYVAGSIDLDYIERTAAPIHPVLAAIERASEAVQPRIPILYRGSGRVLGVLSRGRQRIVEVGTAYGFSTLWMALAQGPEGTIVTIDPDRERTAKARIWWREAGIADARITIVNRPALDAFADDEPALRGPFDLAFIDALKPEYEAYFAALRSRLAPGALVVADNVLWSGRVADEDRPDPGEDTAALRRFNATVLRDPTFLATILPVGDGLLIAALRAPTA